MSRASKHVLSTNDPIDGFPGLIAAGPLLFTSGCEGHRDARTRRVDPSLAADAERQCENAYGGLERLLRSAGADLSSIVRLDHVTSSQDWLPRRQTIRGRLFGVPAPLASTGVAAKMDGLNMVTAAAIAVAKSGDKKVLVPGPRYGMNSISSVVQGGPFLFISGIRATVDPRTGERIAEETPDAYVTQTRRAYEIIRALLQEVGASPDTLLRLDCFIREPVKVGLEAAIRRDVLGDVTCAASVTALPLGARGEVEITALALAPGQVKRTVALHGQGTPSVVGGGGFLFVGECRASTRTAHGFDLALVGQPEAQLEAAISKLDEALKSAGSQLRQCVRIDLYLRDIYFAPVARMIIKRRFGDDTPTLFIVGADLEELCDVKLNAIAI